MLGLILREQRELRDKQDAKLRALLRLAGGTLTVFLTTGTIAVAVFKDDLAVLTAIIVFVVALVLGLSMIPIEGIAHRWQAGPDVDDLLKLFHQPRRTPEELVLALVIAARDDYRRNDAALRRTRGLVAIQACMAFSGIAVLLGGLVAVV